MAEPGAALNKVLGSGLSALGCLLAAAVVVVAIPAPHAAEPVTVSYRADLARLARLAPYPAVAPRGLPASWQPVGSGLTVGGANGAGTVTWQLDYATPDGLLASLEETNAGPAAFVRRMTNSGTALAAILGKRADLEPQRHPRPRAAVDVPHQPGRVHPRGHRQRHLGRAAPARRLTAPGRRLSSRAIRFAALLGDLGVGGRSDLVRRLRGLGPVPRAWARGR